MDIWTLSLSSTHEPLLFYAPAARTLPPRPFYTLVLFHLQACVRPTPSTQQSTVLQLCNTTATAVYKCGDFPPKRHHSVTAEIKHSNIGTLGTAVGVQFVNEVTLSMLTIITEGSAQYIIVVRSSELQNNTRTHVRSEFRQYRTMTND